MDRYEEALERAKEWEREHPNGYVIRDMMEFIFPGYNDSEDECTRKELIHFILYKAGQLLDEETEHKFVAYLEKQKEQKPAARENDFVSKPQTSVEILRHYLVWAGNSESEEDCPYTWRALADAIRDGIKALEEQKPYEPKNWPIDKDNLIQEQKPAEWSEEYREEDLRTRFAFYTYKDEDSALYLSNVFVEETSRNKGFGTKILAAAEKVAETLGAIQIRLKVKQNSPANAWYREHGYGYMTFEDGYDWLEKTLEYPKPSWKPSEEQMECLQGAIEEAESEGLYGLQQGLIDLMESLKKL